MNRPNGFISDKLPNTFQINNKYQNLPRQIENDPYRANRQTPTNKVMQVQHEGLSKDITTEINKQDYAVITEQSHKKDVQLTCKKDRSEKLRNIINNHLFPIDRKQKINKPINQASLQKLNPSQNRYQIILRQVYGSPLSNLNQNQYQQKTSKNIPHTIQKCQSQQLLSKIPKSTDKKLYRYQSENKLSISLSKAKRKGETQYLKAIKGSSYKQLYLNKKKLFL